MKYFLRLSVYLISIVLLLTLNSTIFSAELKKVLILDFINVSKDPGFGYLEKSLTDAARKKLQKKFAYREMAPSEWAAVMKDNHIFREDIHTKSAALQLGLLSRQDVAISGGYTVASKNGKAAIQTTVNILDIAEKKVIASFSEDTAVDSNMFNAVDKIADRIAHEARRVLPNKEDWAGKSISEPLVILNNYTLGARVGGGFYKTGYGEQLTPDLPAFGILARANVPIAWKRLAIEVGGTLMTQQPTGNNAALEGLSVRTSNYLVSAAFALDFILTSSLGLHPKFGGGYGMQLTTVTGTRNENLQNGFPFAMAGLDLSYSLTRSISLVMGVASYYEKETDGSTFYNQLNLGLNYRL